VRNLASGSTGVALPEGAREQGPRETLGCAGEEVTGDWRNLHNEDLSDLHCLSNNMRVIRSKKMRWAGNVACMGEKRNA
jgi:hypothetical protein